MNASEVLKGFAIKQIYSYLGKDPDTNIPKLLDMLEKYDKNGQAITSQVEGIRAALADPENNWSKLVKSLWTDADDEQRKKLVETVAINGTLIGTPVTMKMQDKYQCNIPWAILIDPTSACNLHCTGCWAAEYGNIALWHIHRFRQKRKNDSIAERKMIYGNHRKNLSRGGAQGL